MTEMKQYEVLKWASLFLEENHCEVPVAEILLQHHLGVSRPAFYMTMQEEIPTEVLAAFKADIRKHARTGIPVQHLTGYEYFYGRKFNVSSDTLIPRPETEELVLHIAEEVKRSGNHRPIIVDIGTGSGVIAISLALEIPGAIIYATDISEAALSLAKKNADQLQADVIFYQGDFLQPIIDQKIEPQIIVSNPPYIAKSDQPTLSRTVRDFDPELALFADEDGLAAYNQITMLSTKLSIPPQKIVYEIGYQQGDLVSKIIKRDYPQSEIKVIQDINGKDRIVSARLNA